jgi:hypothetical protein
MLLTVLTVLLTMLLQAHQWWLPHLQSAPPRQWHLMCQGVHFFCWHERAQKTANKRSSLLVKTPTCVAIHKTHSGLAFSQVSCIDLQFAKAHSFPSLQALCLSQNSLTVSVFILFWCVKMCLPN